METAIKISPREILMNEIVSYLQGRDCVTAPYGILVGKHTTKGGRTIRQVTFGKARTLDATIDIYGETYLLLRWSGSLLNHGHGTNSEVFHSKAELFEYLDEAI